MELTGLRIMRRGFTLIELSVVITIIALVLAGGMATLVVGTQQAQYNATIATMNTIEDALLKYAVAYNRLPCPASLTYTAASPLYGVEATVASGATNISGGGCNMTSSTTTAELGTSPAGGFAVSTSSGISTGFTEGAVPTNALRLPDSYMYDGWGHRIRYGVDPAMTYYNTNLSSSCNSAGGICVGTLANAALPPPLGGALPSGTGAWIYDATATYSGTPVAVSTGQLRTNNAAYVLLSHGANGHGAYTVNGLQVNASSSNSAEQVNCHCTSSATNNAAYAAASGAASGQAVYVEQAPTGTALSAYDDIVTFKEPWQLRMPNSYAANPGYIFIANTNGGSGSTDMVLEYIANTQKWVSITASAAVTGGVAIANCNGSITCPNGNLGNLYIGYRGSGIIYQHTPTQNTSTANTFVPSIGTPDYVFVDSTMGYLWTDSGSKVYQYNSAGTNTANYPDSFGSVIIAFVDPQMNIWAVDKNNNEIKYYSYSSSSWVTNGTTTASAALGQFDSPSGVYVDPQGNVWIADMSNNRVQKCSASNGTLTNCVAFGLSCQTSSIPACTAANSPVGNSPPTYNYGFNGPRGIKGDALGNIWVTDTGNNRIMEYNANLGTWGPFANYYENAAGTSQVQFSTPLAIAVVR